MAQQPQGGSPENPSPQEAVPQSPGPQRPSRPEAPEPTLPVGGGQRATGPDKASQPVLQTTVPDDGAVGITIDGRELRVPKGTLLLDAATKLGIHIPIYCAHAKMDPVAVCRMCLVQVEKMPKMQPACATYVNDGMVAHTQTDEVARVREGVLEFLLLNHPLDCPVCDRGGECDLQDFAFRYGPPTSRFPVTEKVHFEKAVPLSDKIELDNERCILCWRCVRYYDEITGEHEIVLQERGVHTVVATFDGRPLQSDFQGNLPEVCPVGALTHRQYRFKARPWDLQRTKSICPECSYGCNINVDSRDFEVKRFASRDNPLVDDMFLCDRGRYSAPNWNGGDRVRRAVVRSRRGGQDRELSVSDAISEAARQLRAVRDEDGGAAIAVLGSPEHTNEELWLLQRLGREVLHTNHLDHGMEAFPELSAEEHSLGIAELETCGAVVVLGPEPERNAPVLQLRLFKAERKKGVRIHRVAADADPAELAERLTGSPLVGVVADESNRAHAGRVAAALSARVDAVRRLTVTRGVNGRGAKDVGLLPNLLPGYRPAPAGGLHGGGIIEAVTGGRVRALVLLGMGRPLEGTAAADALLRAEVVVAIETRPGAVARAATVLLPGHTFMEKQGTVTNLEGRVQRIRQALPPATLGASDLRILTTLARELGAEGWDAALSDPLRAHRALVEALPGYAPAGNGGRADWRQPVA
ncbi:MAG: 2Fe-2S iron-sulfur cluster-binding protein [Candidatus Dormibacteria bacterium]